MGFDPASPSPLGTEFLIKWSPIIHGMGRVTEVAYGVGLSQRAHLAVIPGSAEVVVMHFAQVTFATANYAGGWPWSSCPSG